MSPITISFGTAMEFIFAQMPRVGPNKSS